MPMTTTHALVPVAVALAVAKRPIRWRLVIVAAFASAAPDIDGLFKHLFALPPTSIYLHRGATHSLFVALVSGLIAALFHKKMGVRPITAGVAIAAAMGSHGLLDMMTDTGMGVAYLWPLSSARLHADWRPIHSGPVQLAHFFTQGFSRLGSEVWQLVLPMFVIALAVRAFWALAPRLK